MVNLNLPAFEYKLKKEAGKLWIFDVIRKKYVVLLPEEWVRQHFIHYLVSSLSYPRTLVKVEGGLSYNQLSKRSDIVVFNREGKPWMIIECKSPDIPMTDAILFQAAVYNKTLQARYLVVTNGLIHICSEVDWAAGVTKRLPGMPVFGGDETQE